MNYKPAPHVAALMATAADFAIAEMLQQIGDTVDDDGSIDLNAIVHRVVPIALLLFLMRCPTADLNAMANELKAARIKGADK